MIFLSDSEAETPFIRNCLGKHVTELGRGFTFAFHVSHSCGLFTEGSPGYVSETGISVTVLWEIAAVFFQ